jgi:hypothetical protein
VVHRALRSDLRGAYLMGVVPTHAMNLAVQSRRLLIPFTWAYAFCVTG